MAGCTKCGCELDLRPDGHIDLNNIGIFCLPCADALADEGNRLVATHRRKYGDAVVNERLRMVRDAVQQPMTKH